MIYFRRNKCAAGLSAIIFTSSIIFFYTMPAFSQDKGSPVHAPLNPYFIQHMQKVELYGAEEAAAEGHGLGYSPSPVDLSHLSQLSVQSRALKAYTSSFASKYDLRTTGKLTAVRDQGSCGDCWAFGTLASLESCLLTAETRDFSENNLKNTSGFDSGACGGGSFFMTIAYLSRWNGPVNETDDPYNASSSISPTGLTVQKHIQEVLFIPDRTSSTDNDSIKQAIMTYGAVATSMYMDETNYYNTSTYAYYYNGSTTSNHMVAIVGWDDNYSSTNFKTTPAGNGAFIIKNSWGTSWGESGYFYVSYYDTNIGLDNSVFNGAQQTTNYNNIYQYDPLGMTGVIGYSNSITNTKYDYAWFANIFTATASEELTAVSFYALAPDTAYTINIYTNASSGPISGTLTGGSTSGTEASAGYHTITLSTPVELTSGQKFSIVVQITTPGYYYPIAVEEPVANYSSSATAGAGQSFISYDGSSSSWEDLTTAYSNTNVCLKAFTSTSTSGGSGSSGGSSSSSGKSGCFIATAAFGSPLEKHVEILREFRDQILLNYSAGKVFVNFYYKSSPPIAEKIAHYKGLGFITRIVLMPVIGAAYLAVKFGMATTLLIFTFTILIILFAVAIVKKKIRTFANG